MQQTEPIPREWAEPASQDEHEESIHHDKLQWRDKMPLALALAAQSYVVFLWYLRSTHGIHPYVDFVIALAAGVALDWLTVSTVMGRREGRTSIWSWLTSFGAFIGSATIAYDTYAAHWWPLDGKALLHICFPLVVLLYSLHLATPRKPSGRFVTVLSPSLPSLVPATPELPSGGEPRMPAPVAVDASIASGKATSTTFPCPACGASLESIGELGAAKRWGHCRHCKDRGAASPHQTVRPEMNGKPVEA